MTSIIKVDQIQTAAGGVPTAADLGLNVSGTVLQVVTSRPVGATTFSSGTYTDATGFSVSITPKFSNSLIIINITAQTSMNNTTSNAGQDHRLLRDSTTVVSSQWTNYLNQSDYTADYYSPFVLFQQDTPSTTSTVVYKLQGRTYSGSSASWVINDYNGGSGGSYGCMTVTEIAQ